jgi:chemotaxis protein MotB
MADDKSKQPIIIKKKKGGHAGAHGGAWKIAYADFVTAMMAFFLVMWIIGMDVQTKQGIASYFQNLTARATNEPASPHIVHLIGSPPVKPQPEPIAPRDNNLDRTNAEKLRTQIDALVASSAGFERQRPNLDLLINDKAMRIDITEASDPVPFDGKGQLKLESRKLVEGLAILLKRYRYRMYIEGYHDARAPAEQSLDKWQAAANRACAVRNALVGGGIDPERIIHVRSFGDAHLRISADPINSANRRVSILMPYDLPAEDQPTGSDY